MFERSFKILVDADACPVKDVIVKIARERGVPVLMFIDTSHVLDDGYSKVITVDTSRDAADFALINQTCRGDVVITQDYGVAAMALPRGARVLDQNGALYTEDNIERLLYERHVAQKMRRAGGRSRGPKKRVREDDKRFARALAGLLDAPASPGAAIDAAAG